MGYDVVLLGQTEPTRIDVDQLHQRWESPDHEKVARSLREIEFPSAVSLLATYAGQASGLRSWLEGAEINRDRNLRLQYLAGMGLDSNEGSMIYQELLSYRTFPEEIFTGSGPNIQALKQFFPASPAAR